MELIATTTATATACGKAFQVIFKPCNILYISFYSPRMVAQFAETYTLSGKQIEKVFGLFNISARSAKSTHIW